MNIFKSAIQNLFKGGVAIGYSTGKPFDPREQKRTDGLQDIIESDKKKKKRRKI